MDGRQETFEFKTNIKAHGTEKRKECSNFKDTERLRKGVARQRQGKARDRRGGVGCCRAKRG